MAQHLYREELTAEEFRERKITHIADGITNGANLLCRRANLPMTPRGGRLVLDLPQCWCKPEPHKISTEPSAKLMQMRVLDKSVFCPVHQVHYNVRQLYDILPLGKRKSPEKKDELNATISWNPEPTRYYCHQSGEGSNMTTSINTDPVIALAEAHPSPKQLLRGVVAEVLDIRRAREVLESKSDSLPWRELHGMLRDDLSLPANWHGCSLSQREKMLMHQQELQTAVKKRRERMKMITDLRRDADRLVIEPL